MSMEREERDNQFTGLATRYLAGEATPEEITILSGWIQSDPALEELFREFHKTWMALQGERVGQVVDAEKEWSLFKERFHGTPVITMNSTSPSLFRSKNFMRVAALLLAVLLPALFVLLRNSNPKQLEVTASVAVTDVILPDGSTVSLYPGSSVSYPKKFRGGQRLVTLTGEACFDVTRDASKPFIVTSGSVNVEVLGTTFYVNTRQAPQKMEVILETGRVETYYTGDQTKPVILAPGEKADISLDSRSIVKAVNGDPNFMAWKTRRMTFSNTPLPEIVSVLNKVYQAHITLASPSMNACTMTATFDRQTLPQVLHVMEAALEIKPVTTPEGIELSSSVRCE
jgi:transmembrane sensor